MFTIGQVARFLGVSVDTLRNWEKDGKIKPARSDSGRRLYSSSDIDTLRNGFKGTSKLLSHCVKIKDIKNTIKEMCQDFEDEDVVSFHASQHNGYNGISLGVEGGTKAYFRSLDFDLTGYNSSKEYTNMFSLNENGNIFDTKLNDK